MKGADRKSKDGGILPLVLSVLLVMSILGIGLFRLAETDALETGHAQNRARAFWLAEAGVNEFKAIVSEPAHFVPLENIDLVGRGVVRGSIPDLGTYSVDVIADAENAGRFTQRYTITSTGTAVGGEISRVSIVATIKTWGNFNYASHDEGEYYFGDDDVLGRDISNLEENGTFQTDGELHIYGSPDFYAAVRSSQSSIDYNDGRDGQYADPSVFHNGVELGVDELDFTEQNFDQIERVVPYANRLAGGCAITFIGDQYILEAGSGDISTNQISSLGFSENERIIYVTGDVEVRGEVGTAVSVAAEGSIYITGDLYYSSSNHKPHTEWLSNYQPDDDEVLGLFSETRVQIAKGWENEEGGVNDGIIIHATILVTDENANSHDPTYGGFGAAWDGASGDYDYTKDYGTIYLYGSVSQYRRAAVGLVNKKGYRKEYGYDPRLQFSPAPGTPTTGYELSNWRQL
ncbi:hypothetical protein P4E94_13355 [Pontiellaceae bacterium B12219]|nr:hypothetical protein [Pontiellaceae bacterium B12219]